MNINRRTLGAGLATFLTMSVIATGLVTARSEVPAAPDPSATVHALPVEVVQLRPQSGYELRRTFSGRVQARKQSVLGFELGGRLLQVHVDEGDLVAAGDLLAELDAERLQARRAELTAALAEAEANLALAAATLKRRVAVVEAGGISRQGLDEAREGQRAAAAALELARHRIASLDVELGKTRLHAPYSGTIIARLADEGRVLETGAPVVQLQANTAHEVRIGVAGRAIDHLRPNDSYKLEWGGRVFDATLRAVLPRRAPTARTVDALFDPTEPGLQLRPGDLVTLRLATHVADRGAWLPISALAEGERGLWSVYVAAPDNDAPPGFSATHRVVRRTVDLIHQEADRVYVRGGLTKTDRVVASGLQRIVPGQRVRAFPALLAQGGPGND
jgi:RND family efflux transporter MFP subunit